MELNELWERSCSLLRQEVSGIAYDSLIKDNLIPVSMEENTLVLRIVTDQLRPALTSKYLPDIQACVQKVWGKPLTVEVCTRAELQERQERKPGGETPGDSPSLNDRYTFDTFVVGAGNRFAHAASVAVAEAPGKVYNPLFIYGGAGLGKTHLMHAIGHHIHRQHPEMNLLYITSEAFTNELISAIQQGRNMDFKRRFRTVDILMVDDIQFIAGRDSTQDEFFNTFNDLHNAGKQIILTSDKPPQEIARLEERLRSRFAWGLICDIQRPDLDTRIAILRENASREHMDVPDSILEMIAVNVDSNIRELEGQLIRLKAYAQMMNQPYTEALCREALRDVLENRRRRAITPESILHTVSQFFVLGDEDLTGVSRRREVAFPRQVAMYLTREMTSLSLPQIGAFYGNRDHTTVMHACATIAESCKNNPETLRQVNDIRQMVREG
ncbi:MAG: chromosomal replication initiator protein DnaA [Clostridia bacterium]|nr:chromosomal replication initiator protein DnaA [Clostridia bacterium]